MQYVKRSEYTLYNGTFDEFLGFCDQSFAQAYDSPKTVLPDASFKEYFETCNPSSCEYVEVRTAGPVELITLTVGLLGGLITVIKGTVDFIGGKLTPSSKSPVSKGGVDSAGADVEIAKGVESHGE